MFASFLSPAGMSLPNSPWAGIITSQLNYSCPGGVWLVTSRLETGNSWTFFYGVPAKGAYSFFLNIFIYQVPYTNLPYNNYLPRGAGGGGLQLIFQPINFSRVPIYTAAPTISAEVTIYPARFTALFWLFCLASRPLFTLGPWAFAMV